MGLEYLLIAGLRSKRLVYIPSEKCLFSLKAKRVNGESLICYQEVLRERTEESHPKCSARIKLADGVVTRNHLAHSCHDDHADIYRKMAILNQAEENIEAVIKQFPEMIPKIAVDDVLLKVIAK